MKIEWRSHRDLKSLDAKSKIIFIGAKTIFESKSKLSKLLSPNLAIRVEKFLSRKRADWRDSQVYLCSGIEKNDADLYFISGDEKFSSFECLEFFRNLVKTSLQAADTELKIVFLGLNKMESIWVECFGAALAARTFLMPSFGKKQKEAKKFHLQNLSIYTDKSTKKDFDYGFESGEATNRVRYWGSMPPNKFDPEKYGKEIKKLCSQYKLQLKFYSKTELRKMGAGAFTAVDQANPDSRGGIYEITYNAHAAKNSKYLALVGKGMCFDTGGYDIKTGQSMISMKGDMQGSAVALSTLIAMARMKWPLKAKAYLAVTENYISPLAYKADEVVTALNGTSIEIVNTDAEGRMVLSDTLTLASRTKPSLVIDFATLTGMAVYSIGKNYAAGFTNREEFHASMIESGRRSGERVWPFPMDKDYGKALESTVADTLQCSKSRGIDHILAAVFLQKFIEHDTPWIHIDLAASEKAGGLAHVDTEFTGFGTRWALEFIKRHYKLRV